MNTEPPTSGQAPAANKRDAIHKCVALKQMPHIYNRLVKMWGFPEFFEYIDSLLLVEPGRENRAGFPYAVYREIDALERIFIKFPDEVMDKTLNQAERTYIYQLIKDRAIKVNYTIGDRR